MPLPDRADHKPGGGKILKRDDQTPARVSGANQNQGERARQPEGIADPPGLPKSKPPLLRRRTRIDPSDCKRFASAPNDDWHSLPWLDAIEERHPQVGAKIVPAHGADLYQFVADL